MASKSGWAAFPHDAKGFAYAGDALKKAWPKLHAGDCEPFPDAKRAAALLKAAGKAAPKLDADALAEALQDAWRAFHRGDFKAAFDAGEKLGAVGASVAVKALGIHATYLVDDEAEQLKRYEHAAMLAEAAIKALPDDALKAGASDIHLETTPQGLVVRYRMDGVLQAITRLDGKDFADRAISRIKVLADLDISERRIPQDGRLKLRLAARFIDVRVSIMPSLHGEDAVLRILDRYQIASEDTLSLKHLSFGETDGAFIRRMGSCTIYDTIEAIRKTSSTMPMLRQSDWPTRRQLRRSPSNAPQPSITIAWVASSSRT